MIPTPVESMVRFSQRLFMALVIILPITFNPLAGPAIRASQLSLEIDTLQDSNQPAFQACTAAVHDCSLRGAISLANANPTMQYAISLPAGTYSISLTGASEDGNATGDFDLRGHMTLTGGPFVFIQGASMDRIFHILPGAVVSLLSLSISGGQAPDGADGLPGEPGGGILNQGSLGLVDVTLQENRAGNGGLGLTGGVNGGDGGSGGGIYNAGYLTLQKSVLLNNTAGTGGAGYVCVGDPYELFCSDCSTSGNGGLGGGMHNIGILSIQGTTVNTNASGQAGAPGACIVWGYSWYHSGLSGAGGGISSQNYLALSGSQLSGNQAASNGGGLSASGYARIIDVIATGNQAHSGGAIHNQHRLELEDSSLDGNTAEYGGGLYNLGELHMLTVDISNNNAALGGGLYNLGKADLVSGTIQGNWTRDGTDGEDETPCVKDPCPPTAGLSPHGGGVYNTGSLQLDDCSVSANATGDGGDGGDGFDFWGGAEGGHGGFGGGIYNTGTLEINHTDVFSNTTGDGGLGGIGLSNGLDGKGGFGGGLYNSGVLTATLSPLRDNQTGTGLGGAGCGGGLANQGSLTYSFAAVTHNQTSLGGDGGGIYTSSPLTLTRTTVMSNTAGGRGGGVFVSQTHLTASSNLLARNQAGIGFPGSGIYLDDSTAHLLHTTLAQNTGGDGTGMLVVDSSVWLTNTILVSQTLGIWVALGSTAELENTLWGSGEWANQTDWDGDGSLLMQGTNLWEEPGFLDPAALDYHLSPDSPAVDRGAPSASRMDLDSQPVPDPSTAIADLGADEYWAFTPVYSVSISGPLTATTVTPLTFSAEALPGSATPNILFYWLPPPDSGQWTDTAVYHWTRPGLHSASVAAIQIDQAVDGYLTVFLEPYTYTLFLPHLVR